MKQLPTLAQLLQMSPDQLAQQDVAAVNLACAEGLYGAENLDKQFCLHQLDEWAAGAGRLLKEREFMFHAHPDKSNFSINRWRCAALVQYLNQIVGLRYNPVLKGKTKLQRYETSFYHDSRNFLIHGLITETNRGTCSSMPVLFTAVARRLGFPITLVTTSGHLFARWDSHSTNEVFNIETTDKFAEFKSDDFYKTFPVTLRPGTVERHGYLISLTPERVLSAFLHLRAMCLWDHGRIEEARDTFIASARLDPGYKQQGLQNDFVREVERLIAQGNRHTEEATKVE